MWSHFGEAFGTAFGWTAGIGLGLVLLGIVGGTVRAMQRKDGPRDR